MTCEPTELDDGLGIMLDPARTRIGGQDLQLALADRFQPLVVDDRPGARRSLIDHQKMVARHQPLLLCPGLSAGLFDMSRQLNMPHRPDASGLESRLTRLSDHQNGR